jgi:hypothetical protein
MPQAPSSSTRDGGEAVQLEAAAAAGDVSGAAGGAEGAAALGAEGAGAEEAAAKALYATAALMRNLDAGRAAFLAAGVNTPVS